MRDQQQSDTPVVMSRWCLLRQFFRGVLGHVGQYFDSFGVPSKEFPHAHYNVSVMPSSIGKYFGGKSCCIVGGNVGARETSLLSTAGAKPVFKYRTTAPAKIFFQFE